MKIETRSLAKTRVLRIGAGAGKYLSNLGACISQGVLDLLECFLAFTGPFPGFVLSG
jgi:hypothetical protein